jgi:glutamine amidotransferase
MKGRLVGIIDYGLGNIGSIANMVRNIGDRSIYITNPSELDNPEIELLILPGVGSFDRGVELLKENQFFESIKEYALRDKRRILGILPRNATTF